MKKLLSALVIAAFVLPFAGCGGADMDDAKFVEVWLATYDKMDDEEAYAAALKEHGLTPGEIDDYIKKLLEDEERSEKVTNEITEKDLGAGLAFAGKVLAIALGGLSL